MLEVIFLKTNKQLYDVTKEIFNFFNLNEFEEGESSFYIDNKYYYGVINQEYKIKISKNNYDYEDLFNVYISLSSMNDDSKDFIKNFCQTISNDLNTLVAIEIELIENNSNDSLIYFYPNKT